MAFKLLYLITSVVMMAIRFSEIVKIFLLLLFFIIVIYKQIKTSINSFFLQVKNLNKTIKPVNNLWFELFRRLAYHRWCNHHFFSVFWLHLIDIKNEIIEIVYKSFPLFYFPASSFFFQEFKYLLPWKHYAIFWKVLMIWKWDYCGWIIFDFETEIIKIIHKGQCKAFNSVNLLNFRSKDILILQWSQLELCESSFVALKFVWLVFVWFLLIFCL